MDLLFIFWDRVPESLVKSCLLYDWLFELIWWLWLLLYEQISIWFKAALWLHEGFLWCISAAFAKVVGPKEYNYSGCFFFFFVFSWKFEADFGVIYEINLECYALPISELGLVLPLSITIDFFILLSGDYSLWKLLVVILTLETEFLEIKDRIAPLSTWPGYFLLGSSTPAARIVLLGVYWLERAKLVSLSSIQNVLKKLRCAKLSSYCTSTSNLNLSDFSCSRAADRCYFFELFISLSLVPGKMMCRQININLKIKS